MNYQEIRTIVDSKNPAPERLEIGRCKVQTNHGYFTVIDAVWERYDLADKYNPNGTNGCLSGEIEEGGDTNRLFWATSFTDRAGEKARWDYVSLDRCWAVNAREWQKADGEVVTQDLTPVFNLQFCG